MPDVQEVFRMATQKVRPDPGALERQNRDQRRRSVTQRVGGYAVVAILAIAAVLIAVFAAGGEREERPAGQREEEPSAAAATGPFFFDLDTGETRLLPENLRGGYNYIASPDGTSVAYDPDDDACVPPQEALTIANIDGTGVRTIESPEGGSICGTQWSPDGTKLVYQERPSAPENSVGNLVVHDLATGQRTQVTDLELTEAGWYWLAPSFTADGQNVLFQLPRSSAGKTQWDVWSVPVTGGGEPTLVLRDATFPMDTPTGPEGMQIAFLEPRANHPVGTRLMTGRPVPTSDLRQILIETTVPIWWPTMSPDGTRIAYYLGGSIDVVELGTGELSEVGSGEMATWVDNDTLIVSP